MPSQMTGFGAHSFVCFQETGLYAAVADLKLKLLLPQFPKLLALQLCISDCTRFSRFV